MNLKDHQQPLSTPVSTRSVEAGTDSASSSLLFCHIQDRSLHHVCCIIPDADGRPRRIQPVPSPFESHLNPVRIRGETLDALQIIDPVLQHKIAVVHLPTRPYLTHLGLESRVDFEISLWENVRSVGRGELFQSRPVSRSSFVLRKPLTTAYFKMLCFFMI